MKHWKVKVDPELVPLVPEFLKSRWVDRKSMDISVRNEDYESLKSLGHLLQGAPGCFGFHFLVAIGKRIEIAAAKKDLRELKVCQKQFEDFLQNHTVVERDKA
jgi:hypothetical protein